MQIYSAYEHTDNATDCGERAREERGERKRERSGAEQRHKKKGREKEREKKEGRQRETGNETQVASEGVKEDGE